MGFRNLFILLCAAHKPNKKDTVANCGHLQHSSYSGPTHMHSVSHPSFSISICYRKGIQIALFELQMVMHQISIVFYVTRDTDFTSSIQRAIALWPLHLCSLVCLCSSPLMTSNSCIWWSIQQGKKLSWNGAIQHPAPRCSMISVPKFCDNTSAVHVRALIPPASS